MSRDNNTVGIDIVAVQHYQDTSESCYKNITEHYGEFEKNVSSLLYYDDDSHPLLRVISHIDNLITTWTKLISLVSIQLELINDPPAFSFPEPIWIREAGVHVVLDGSERYNTDWNRLRTKDQSILVEYAPDIVLEMRNVPPLIRQSAEALWYRSVESTIQLAGTELRIEVEVDVLWIELSAELFARKIIYADGRVRLEYEAIGELGVEAGLKLADVEAGAELSILIAHEFDSVAEAVLYEAQLAGAIGSVGGVPRAVQMLTSGKSIRNATTKAGVYVAAEVEFGDLAEVEGRLSTGIGRDWITEENLLYLGGTLSLEADTVSAEVEVVGEWRKGIDTERVVVEGRFEAEADLLSEHFEMPEDMSLASGMEVKASLELDLEDTDQRQAWMEFTRGRLSFAELLRYGSVIGTISARKSVSSEDLDVLAVEIEIEKSAKATVATFHQNPGRPVRWISGADIVRHPS